MNSSKPTDSQQASLPAAEVQLDAAAPVAPDARHRRNCLFRKAAADEFGRAASLCPPPPSRTGEGPQRCFVAVRTRPVERLLAAAFWKRVPETHGDLSVFSESPSLFDPRCSGVIIADGEISAACLANASHGHLTLAALAGPEEISGRLLHHSLQGRDGLAEPATLSFHLDDRDPPSALAALLERLPHQSAGQFTRYARLLAASVPSAASPLSHLRHPHSADSETKTHIEKRKPNL